MLHFLCQNVHFVQRVPLNHSSGVVIKT